MRFSQNTSGYPHPLQIRLETVIVAEGSVLKRKKLKIQRITQ